MEYFIEYGLFAAKLLTVVILGLISIAAIIVFMFARSHGRDDEHIEVKNLNDKYRAMGLALKSAMLSPKEFKSVLKQEKNEQKKRDKAKNDNTERRRIFVCQFDGDIKASAVNSLREEITAILSIAKKEDEVVALIESPGGTVHGYGLAASQLARVKERDIKLTAAVDKVAASGGYMMACVADEIIAAPFAIIGSIGVVAQMPNFNRLLKKHDIDFEEITAGEYKRTLTMFGENSESDRKKFREELEDAHTLFKEFVSQHRPSVDIDKIATGEHWFGTRALEHKLVDKMSTSDDYLFSHVDVADIYQVEFKRRRTLFEKLFGTAAMAFQNIINRYV